jgi:membrane protein implicated in regulation of membrane protease activity
MRGWLAASAFLVGTQAFAAALFFSGHSLIKTGGFLQQTEQVLVGCFAIVAVIATGFAARAVLRRIEKRP